MTELEYEVCTRFKNADLNQDRVRLIQDLTLLSKNKVIQILIDNGYKVLPREQDRELQRIETKRVFLELYNSGKSIPEIALKLGVSEGTARMLENYYVKVHNDKDLDKTRFEELYKQGMNDSEIAEELDYNKSSISRWRYVLGWPPNNYKNAKKNK